jgi:hypothetical protein
MVLAMALTFIALAAGTAFAETYVEGYIGNNFPVTSPNPIEFNVNPLYRQVKTYPEYPRILSTSLIGGAKLGTWFSKQGFPSFQYPDWMKYLGFYLDLNFQGMYFFRGVGSRRMYLTPSNFPYYTIFTKKQLARTLHSANLPEEIRL